MDWLTAIMTIVSMELVARKSWYGWALGLLNQGLWAYLIVSRELWGIAPLCIVLVWRYTAAMRRWRRES